MSKFLQLFSGWVVMIEILTKKGAPVKKTHLLTKPTRNQDIDFDNFEDNFESMGSGRAERSRVRSYRKVRNQEA